MVFSSQLIFNIFMKLFRSFFFTKTPLSACYSIKLSYYCHIFFYIKISYTRWVFHKSCKYTNIKLLLHKVFLDCPRNLRYLPKRYWSCKMLFRLLRCWIEIYRMCFTLQNRKNCGFFPEARTNSKITRFKTRCVVMCHGKNNGNHVYYGQWLG